MAAKSGRDDRGCIGVPSQFLVTTVVYPDPDLDVTSSTGTMHVHGEVVDHADPELGSRDLLVVADDIDL